MAGLNSAWGITKGLLKQRKSQPKKKSMRSMRGCRGRRDFGVGTDTAKVQSGAAGDFLAASPPLPTRAAHSPVGDKGGPMPGCWLGSHVVALPQEGVQTGISGGVRPSHLGTSLEGVAGNCTSWD